MNRLRVTRRYLVSFAYAAFFYANFAAFLLVFGWMLLMPFRMPEFVMKAWANSSLRALKIIAGIGVEFRGLQNLPQGTALVAAKHYSVWETFALLAPMRDPVGIMKKELLNRIIYGWFCRRLGMIGVDRDGGAKALKTMLRQAEDAAKSGRQILIFPEGSRVDVDEDADYKPGVAALYARLNAPCVPVALNSALYWGKTRYLKRRGTILAEFLEPIPAGLPREQFMRLLKRRIDDGSKRLLAEGARDDPTQRAPDDARDANSSSK